MVFSGLVTAWRLAGWPTRRSPSSVKATIDGVVRAPSAFSMTFGDLPSITATQELVVPRSIPMTLPMCSPLFLAGRPGLLAPAQVPRLIRRAPSPDPLTTRFAAIFRRLSSYRRGFFGCKAQADFGEGENAELRAHQPDRLTS